MQEDVEVRPDSPTLVVCKQCGASVSPNVRECANCGTAVSSERAEKAQPKPPLTRPN